MIAFNEKSSMKARMTDSLTARPTPAGPPPALSPLYAPTIAAVKPKTAALIRET